MKSKELKLTGFSDSDLGGSIDDIKAHLHIVLVLNQGCFHGAQRSKKQ